MGLLQDLVNNSNKVTYNRGSLTLKDLKEAINKLFTNRPPPQPILYMGRNGYALIEFSSYVSQLFPGLRYWYYIPKRVHGFIYISLFQKHSLFKVKLYTDGTRHKYELFHGTTSIGKSDSVESIRHLIRLNKNMNVYIP